MSRQPRAMTIAGWALTGLLAAFLTFSAVMKFVRPKEMIDEFVGRLGYAEGHAVAIGIVELVCLLVFLCPRTAMLGAILLTGYLGGATATHVRVNDPFYGPVVAGMLVWLAIFLREPRVRELVPILRRRAA